VLKFAPWKDYKAVTRDLKSITEDETLLELERFAEKWENLNTIFAYLADIRKVIYTKNAIESLNRIIRKSVKTRKVFPSDDTDFKVVYLAIQAASKKWTMPIRDWRQALPVLIKLINIICASSKKLNLLITTK